MRIITWNVNGIRSVYQKGFIDWLNKEIPDVLCVQETKANPEQLSRELTDIAGYKSYWHSATRRGYSGVATYTRKQPVDIIKQIDIEEFDNEGRILITLYDKYILLNIYFPNGQMNEDRLNYKLRFYEEVMNYCDNLKKSYRNIIICGDFNTAHNEIDLKNPRENENRSGFLKIEREILDQFLSRGYNDVFRRLYPEKVQYSWWSYRTRARERNAGWRIDYFYVSNEMFDEVVDCRILDDVYGSDHCPVLLEIK